MGTCDGLAMKAQRPKPQHLETSDTLCEAAQLPTQCRTQKGEGGWVNNLELEPPPAWNRRSVGETPSRQSEPQETLAQEPGMVLVMTPFLGSMW